MTTPPDPVLGEAYDYPSGFTGNITVASGKLQLRNFLPNHYILPYYGNITISGGTFEVNNNSRATTFGGLISGGDSGHFIKSGTGILVLWGSAANTFTGKTTVSGGTLKLQSSNAIVGSLTIQNDAVVDAIAYAAINLTSPLTMSGGTLQLHNMLHGASELNMTGGTIVGNSAEDPGALFVAGGVTVTNATINHVYFLSDGGLNLYSGAVADIRGGFSKISNLFITSTLTVNRANVGDSESALTFYEGLHAHSGATIALLLGQADQAALIDVNGGFSVGDILYNPFTQQMRFSGQVIIDLSGNTDLTPGTYNLIDFSGHADLLGGYPSLARFTLIPPSLGQGHLAINNHVLQYITTPIPEPGSLLLCALGLAGLLSRRSRERTGVTAEPSA